MTKPSVSDAALPRFRQLVELIRTVDEQLSTRAVRAVNSSLTLRNWLIGFRIQEYEQRGAEYGDRLFKKLAAELKQQGVSRSEARELRRYRLFYQMYPQIWETLSPEIRKSLGSSDLRGNQGSRESLTPLSGHDLIGQ